MAVPPCGLASIRAADIRQLLAVMRRFVPAAQRRSVLEAPIPAREARYQGQVDTITSGILPVHHVLSGPRSHNQTAHCRRIPARPDAPAPLFIASDTGYHTEVQFRKVSRGYAPSPRRAGGKCGTLGGLVRTLQCPSGRSQTPQPAMRIAACLPYWTRLTPSWLVGAPGNLLRSRGLCGAEELTRH